MEQEDEKSCLKSFPQVYSKQMVVVMIQQMMMTMAQEGVGIGMVPIIAQHTRQRVDVMSAATWWKPPLSTRITSRGGLRYMDIMSIFLLQRKTNCLGLFTAVRTLSATCSMLGAQRMCVRGRPARKKRVWTVTVLELACISISRTGVPVEVEEVTLSI